MKTDVPGWYTSALYLCANKAMLIDELLTSLFDGQPNLLAAPMTTWLASSRRFADFVTSHQTKIRKKLRVAQEPQRLRDLQLELETAYLLLRERALSLEYEPQLGGTRSPDFAVSYTTSFVFMVEVTRLRTFQPRTSREPEDPNNLLTPTGDRFSDMVCSKLGQLLAQRSNVLLVGVEGSHLPLSDLQAMMLRLQQRAESNDSTVVQRHGFRDRADFFNHYQRLSALLVRGIPLQSGEPAVIWENPQAKYPLPAKVRTVLSRSHTL